MSGADTNEIHFKYNCKYKFKYSKYKRKQLKSSHRFAMLLHSAGRSEWGSKSCPNSLLLILFTVANLPKPQTFTQTKQFNTLSANLEQYTMVIFTNTNSLLLFLFTVANLPKLLLFLAPCLCSFWCYEYKHKYKQSAAVSLYSCKPAQTLKLLLCLTLCLLILMFRLCLEY